MSVLYVQAGVAHRFEGLSGGLAVRVLFYGPEGGEAARGDDGSQPFGGA